MAARLAKQPEDWRAAASGVITTDRLPNAITWGLLGLYGLVAAYHGWKLRGPQTLTDSPRYLHLAQNLFQPAAWEPGDLWYWAYAALIRLIGGPDWLWGIVALQLLLGAVSLGVLIRLADRWGGPWAGGVAGLFLLAWVDYQAFHWKIYTESLFTSLGFLAVAALALGPKGRTWAWLAPLIGVCLFLRPTGIGLLATLAVWGVWQLPARARGVALALGALLGLALLNRMLAGFEVVQTNAQGVVLFGYHGLCVPRPTDWVHPDYRGTAPLLVLLGSWWDYPWFNLQLALAKGFWFLANLRPFYSLAHNAYLVGLLLLMYPLAAWGWRRLPRAARLPIGVYLVGQLGIVMLTAADWDGRFFHPLVPLLALLAGLGLPRWLLPTPADSAL